MAGKISLLIIVLIISPLLSNGQNRLANLPIDANGQIVFTQNVAIPNTEQSVLYSRALRWITGTKTYKFKKIDMVDTDFGRFLASGEFVIGHDEVFISLSVDVKNNKAQLKVTRFDYNIAPGNIPIDNLSDQKTKEAKLLTPLVRQTMTIFLNSFVNAMQNETKIN
jgi:hypothetical protein